MNRSSNQLLFLFVYFDEENIRRIFTPNCFILFHYFQVQDWLGVTLAPEDYGWKRVGPVLLPEQGHRNICPPAIKEVLKCACTKGCMKNCSCKKNGLTCSAACNCKNCENIMPHDLDDTDESETEETEEHSDDM